MTEDMLIQGAILVASLYALLKGADLLVDNAAILARRKGLSEATIGLTLVAIGTSLPELVVSVISSLEGRGQLSYGNVTGSNIANILMVVGLTAIVKPIKVAESFSTSDIICFLASGVMPLGLLLASGGLSGSSFVLGLPAGLALLALAVVFFYGTYRAAKDQPVEDHSDEDSGASATTIAGLIVAGLLLLVAGGHFVIESASAIAGMVGLSESFIGLSIVAFGTSLPELVTSIVAATKGKPDLAIGNVIGSNILNVGLVLGTAATLSPMAFGRESLALAMAVAIASAVFYLTSFVWPRQVSRTAGSLWAFCYIAYITVMAMAPQM